ncbi:Uu.00g003500.m01.CDS01 [Anthostomella pinea]|uniref:Uu.00g003500.m01.CDS01 n=1 Tax=Anthostomella pinea TaxID=933095 RepID=A0AAI8VKW9_9PEZI|nr:Uu.00g003500.m01.CDS01 [Anthostomella pinea]
MGTEAAMETMSAGIARESESSDLTTATEAVRDGIFRVTATDLDVNIPSVVVAGAGAGAAGAEADGAAGDVFGAFRRGISGLDVVMGTSI